MQVSKVNINVIKEKMNIILALLLNFSVALNGFNCTKQIQQGKNDPLPDKRPEKLVIEYHLSGGMRYYSEALYLSEDSSYYTVNDGGAISRVNFKITPQDFDNLYKIFVENKFDRIGTFEEKVYDRGGNTIFLRWDNGKMASVSNSGMTFVKDKWLNEWSLCLDAVEKIARDESAKQQKDYELRFDKSLFGNPINVYVNDKQVISNKDLTYLSSGNEVYIDKIKLIPGKHRISISFDKKYDNIQLDADSSKGIFIFMKNDSIQYEFIK
jgi:hypothetical protein